MTAPFIPLYQSTPTLHTFTTYRDQLVHKHQELHDRLATADARTAEAEGRSSVADAALAALGERQRAASKQAKALGKRCLQLQGVLQEQVRGHWAGHTALHFWVRAFHTT